MLRITTFLFIVLATFSCNKQDDVTPIVDLAKIQQKLEEKEKESQKEEESKIPLKKVDGIEGNKAKYTGIIVFDNGNSVNGSKLLSEKEFVDLVYKSSVTQEEKQWSEAFLQEVNKAREAYRGGENSWNNYLTKYLNISNKDFIEHDLAYSMVRSQVPTIPLHDIQYDENLTIGAVKWSTFLLSHVNRNDKLEFYPTKDGCPSNGGKKNRIGGHDDVNGRLGFELSKADERGAEVMGYRWKGVNGKPKKAVAEWIIDRGKNNKGIWGHRKAILSADYHYGGGYADREEGVPIGRFR